MRLRATGETMAAMVGTVGRSRLSAVCCALLAAALLGACARVVSGTPHAADRPVRPSRQIPITDLVIDVARFPDSYPGAVVPSREVQRVIDEIDGVAAGSDVMPPQCAPLPVLADHKAAVQGTSASGATLTVTVVRPVPSLRARVTQLAECPSFTTSGPEAGDGSTVTVRLPPAPPVDAADSYAVDSTVTPKGASPPTRTLTLVALVDDVQVTTSWQQRTSSDASPDTQALDALFTAAVLTVRQKLPR